MEGKTGSQIVREVLASSGKSQASLARYLGYSKQNLNNRLKEERLKYNEVVKALEFCGYELKANDVTGKNDGSMKEGLPRVRKIVNGYPYDTDKAKLLCVCKSSIDKILTIALFQMRTGKFFIVFYEFWDGGDTSISPIDKDTSSEIIEAYRQNGYNP